MAVTILDPGPTDDQGNPLPIAAAPHAAPPAPPAPSNPLATNAPSPQAPSWLIAPNSLASPLPTEPTASNSISAGANPPGIDPNDKATWQKDKYGLSIPPLGPNPNASPSVFDPSLYSSAAGAYGNKAPGSDDEAKRMVLNKIASGEARSYNEMYSPDPKNPRFFSDFSDHPHSAAIDPKTGRPSDAAGLYQFIGPTWQAEKTKLGLKDFSPASQDAAAWDYANTEYKSKTGGRDLLSDAKAGNVHWASLGGAWESLAGAKSGPGLGGPAPSMGGAHAPSGGNSPQGQISQNSPGSPPQTQDLSGLFKLARLQAAFPQHQFQPIQYDPFKVEQQERVG